MRDYRRANNLCFACGDKYEPGHNEVCPKKQKPQVLALVVNDMDKEEITENQLNQLAVEDALAEDFCHLSLHAFSSAHSDNSIKLKSMVQDKVMLILIDLGSSHSFISANFVKLAKLPTVLITPRKVKLADGHWLTITAKVPNLQWYIQGHTLSSDMIVLDMPPYDAILGYDWLRGNSPMSYDWNKKTLAFNHKGQHIKLHGLLPAPLEATPISATKLYNSTKGNDAWAFAIFTTIESSLNYIDDATS